MTGVDIVVEKDSGLFASWRKSTVLAVRFDPRHNSLNALRLVLATAVIVSHAWPLGGFGPDPSPARQSLGHWAVVGFFAVSGYLIAASRARTGLGAFLAARVLRIYPAFLVCLVLVAFVAAPISTVISSGHWTPGGGASYVAHNILLKIEQNGVSATLPKAPYGPAWDGSLWTLFYEFVCYLMVGAMLSAPSRWHKPLAWAAFVLTAIGSQVEANKPTTGAAADFLSLAPVFLAGTLLYLYADRVPVNRSFGVVALLLLPVAGWLNIVSSVGAPFVAYACLWLGVMLPLQRVGRRNDISYGVYIYAFPVQQLLVVGGLARHGVALYVLLSVVLTLPMAAASWFAVERPALSLKKRLRRTHVMPETIPAETLAVS